jgi:predicted ATPase
MINQLQLFQFKSFKQETFNFSNLTLLTGVNGIGKSSIIQSLLVLRNSFDRGEIRTQITIQDSQLVNLVSPDDMLSSRADSSEVGITLVDDQLGIAEWRVKSEGASNTLPLIKELSNVEIAKFPLFQSTFQYLNAERIGPRQFYDKLAVKRNHSPLGYFGEYTASRLSQAVTDLEICPLKKLHLEGISDKVYDLVSGWVSKIIYPGTKVNLDDTNPTRITLQFSFDNEKGKKFNPVNIGFGFSFALPVILAVLTAKPGDLIIVENPEAPSPSQGTGRNGALPGPGSQFWGTDYYRNPQRPYLKRGTPLRKKR